MSTIAQLLASYASGDPYFSSVVCALHMDGTDGSTTFTDLKGHTFTVVGNAQIDTAQSQFGGASYLGDGTTDCIHSTDATNFDLDGVDWTVDLWVRIADASTIRHIFSIDSNQLAVRYQGTTIVVVSNNAVQFSALSAFSLNTWYHLALVRSGGTITLYLGGTSIGSATANSGITSGVLVIGAWDSGGTESHSGWIDDFRITKGVARYTTNFTPPTSAFPDA